MMKKILVIVLIWFTSLAAVSQKAAIQVVKTPNAAKSEWQIMDEEYNPVFSGNEYFRDDSVSFSLDVSKRYILEISVSQIMNPDTTLFKLYINNEPVILVRSDIGSGDHFYFFYTGVLQKVAKITGGLSTDISSFPWQVYFESGNYTCGGSIIGDRWILTAAHCTMDDNGHSILASAMDVRVGANDPAAGEGKKYLVSEVIVNSGFDPNTLVNDIALLKLTEPISYTNATPIKLVSKLDSAAGATDPGVMSWVTGYGLTRVRPPTFPTTLQKVQLPIISIAQASTVWSDIAATDLMAGFLNGNKDACSGDSGGPLVVPFGGGYKLAGIVSWGSSSCDTYGAYTRVSDFEQWISSNTGIEISYSPPVPAGDSIVCHGVASGQYTVGTVNGATAYEWQLLPLNAGTITSNNGQAIVTWDTAYTGAASIKLRVTRNNTVSDWSVLYVHLAKITRILSQSKDTIMCAEQPLSLNMNTEGYNLIYSWYKNSALLKSGKSASVDLSSASTDNSGLYTCNISGSCSSANSAPINLTVYPLTAISDVSPDSETAFGGTVTLSVNAGGHDLTYQWEKDNSTLSNGNDSVFVLTNVTAKNIGLYKVTVAGTCGTVSSGNIYVYVKKADYTTEPEVFVWPTVTNSRFNVALSDEQTYNIRLFTTTGRLMLEKTGCQYQTTLSLSDIPAGLYIATIYNDKFRKSVKVLKN
jgi:secreted trypsin-like serine protease